MRETGPMTSEGAVHTALAVPSRQRLLDVLRATQGPMDVPALAAAVGLHVTTTRFHLEALERSGLVVRSAEHAGRPGRPRQLYAAVVLAEVADGHRQLAELLAGVLAAEGQEGPRRAEQAGWAWATDYVPEPASLLPEDAVQQVIGVFARLGFAPRRVDADHLELDDCPFRDIARKHPEVVCSIHLGLMRGILSRLGAASTAAGAGLRPFVEPELCVADLTGQPRAGSVA
ncbi:MAG: putative transcriptional regulator, ArsR family [Frankiales bacterium]|nr:putative transcriptional regulator, ArsR family [Frankiales bacterium]